MLALLCIDDILVTLVLWTPCSMIPLCLLLPSKKSLSRLLHLDTGAKKSTPKKKHLTFLFTILSFYYIKKLIKGCLRS